MYTVKMYNIRMYNIRRTTSLTQVYVTYPLYVNTSKCNTCLSDPCVMTILYTHTYHTGITGVAQLVMYGPFGR